MKVCVVGVKLAVLALTLGQNCPAINLDKLANLIGGVLPTRYVIAAADTIFKTLSRCFFTY